MTDLGSKLTQQQFGALVGISQPAVAGLFKDGVLSKGMTGGQALQAYCSHLREIAAGRLAAGDLDLAEERAKLAKAQREKIELQNAVTRRELAPVGVLEQVLSNAAAKIAGVLDAIPGGLRRRNKKLTAKDIEHVAGEIAKAQNAVADLRLADVMGVDDDGGPDDDSNASDVIEGEAA